LLLLDKTLLNIEGLGRSLYPDLDLWATAKPFLENLVKEKYSFKNSVKQITEQLPELLAELPQLPMLAIKALKQLEKGAEGQKIAKRQTDIIVKQLKENAAKQSAVIFTGALVILSGILTTQSLWLYASVSSALAVLFWLKSR